MRIGSWLCISGLGDHSARRAGSQRDRPRDRWLRRPGPAWRRHGSCSPAARSPRVPGTSIVKNAVWIPFPEILSAALRPALPGRPGDMPWPPENPHSRQHFAVSLARQIGRGIGVVFVEQVGMSQRQVCGGCGSPVCALRIRRHTGIRRRSAHRRQLLGHRTQFGRRRQRPA